MIKNLHGFANGWTFASEEKKERLIEEITRLLETYDELKGSLQVTNELAGLLKLAQSGSREVAAAIKSLSPVAHSMLNYPTPLPNFTATSHTSINDEIREIEHTTYNNSRITNEQNNKSIIFNSII